MRAIVLLLLLAGCATTCPPAQPKIVTQTVVKEVQRPCAVTVPARPTPLAKPLPTDLAQLAATLGEKLSEWAAPGGYGDRADAALKVCSQP